MRTDWWSRLRPKLGVVWLETSELVWALRRRLALGFLVLLVGRLAGLVLPALLKFLIDEVIGNQRLDLLGWIVSAAVVGTALQAASSFGLSFVLGLTAQRSITELRQSIEQHVIRLPVSFFDSKKSGELVSRVMYDADAIRELVGTGFVYLAGSLVTGALALGVLLVLDWQLTLVVLLMIVLYGSVAVLVLRRLRPLYRERSRLYARTLGHLSEVFSGIRIVKAYTSEKREDRVFARATHDMFRVTRRTLIHYSGVTALSTVSFGLLAGLMMWFGARAIAADTMTIGDFVMYVAFVGFLMAPLAQVASIASQLSEAFAGLDRIREVRKLVGESDEDSDRQRVRSMVGKIDFEAVSFSYHEGVPVLREVAFSVPAGTTTALVGPSGAGKSTIFRLVMAFDDPDAGRVLIDGRDLGELRRSDYRRFLGVVLQDQFLFDGTIFDNIRYSQPRASRAEVEQAARLAHCEEFVSAFEDGYDTLIGERGVRLSGGQRQRVAIARAILADPRILLLDEATSNLDSESEAMIQDGLRVLRSGRTTFVIAHRLSTIRSADQILVLEEGRVIERGRHQELLASGGRYGELWRRQSGSFETEPATAEGEDWSRLEKAGSEGG